MRNASLLITVVAATCLVACGGGGAGGGAGRPPAENSARPSGTVPKVVRQAVRSDGVVVRPKAAARPKRTDGAALRASSPAPAPTGGMAVPPEKVNGFLRQLRQQARQQRPAPRSAKSPLTQVLSGVQSHPAPARKPAKSGTGLLLPGLTASK